LQIFAIEFVFVYDSGFDYLLFTDYIISIIAWANYTVFLCFV